MFLFVFHSLFTLWESIVLFFSASTVDNEKLGAGITLCFCVEV